MKHVNPDAPSLVRGTNDVGSVMALLFRIGHMVATHEMSQPTSIRRSMSFTDANFDESASLDGTSLASGQAVTAGQKVACIDSTPLQPLIAGNPARLNARWSSGISKNKSDQVDPRLHAAQVAGIGERPGSIAEAVLTAIQQ